MRVVGRFIPTEQVLKYRFLLTEFRLNHIYLENNEYRYYKSFVGCIPLSLWAFYDLAWHSASILY